MYLGKGGKSSTSEVTGPNIKRIIPGTDNQQGDEERRNALEFSALLFFFILFVIEFMMCYSMPCIAAGAV